jgi:Trypsin-co-occurring domain 2
MSSPDDTRPLFVRELIRRVHEELVESREERERQGLPPIFEVENMTIEVNFVATETREARGGLDFRVITAGGSRSYDQQQVHKITLSLAAVSRRGDPFTDLEAEGARFMPREED